MEKGVQWKDILQHDVWQLTFSHLLLIYLHSLRITKVESDTENDFSGGIIPYKIMLPIRLFRFNVFLDICV